MPTDRDTLARDLLTLPALVEAPGEVVRGLCLVHPSGVDPWPIDCDVPAVWTVYGEDYTPAMLHRKGWRVDLDAWGSVGPLLGLLPCPVIVVQCDEPDCDAPWMLTCPGADEEGATLAEAAARALMEVARGR